MLLLFFDPVMFELVNLVDVLLMGVSQDLDFVVLVGEFVIVELN